MKNRYILYGFAIIVISVIVLNIVLILNIKADTVKEIKVSRDSISLYRNKFDVLIDNSKYQYLSEDYKLNKPLTVIDEKSVYLNIDSLYITKDVFVFRFSEVNCMSCVNKQFALINKFIEIYGEKSILLIATYSTIRELSMFKRINNIKIPIYRVETKQLEPNIESLRMPYYFLLEKGVSMKMIHIPSKETPFLTQFYIETVAMRMFGGIEP